MDSVMSTANLAISQASIPSTIVPPAGRGGNVDKAASSFESMFMSQMLQPMFEGLPVDSTFGGGHAEELMRSLLVQEYGKIASKNGHFGIADAVKAQMLKIQGLSNASPTTSGV